MKIIFMNYVLLTVFVFLVPLVGPTKIDKKHFFDADKIICNYGKFLVDGIKKCDCNCVGRGGVHCNETHGPGITLIPKCKRDVTRILEIEGWRGEINNSENGRVHFGNKSTMEWFIIDPEIKTKAHLSPTGLHAIFWEFRDTFNLFNKKKSKPDKPIVCAKILPTSENSLQTGILIGIIIGIIIGNILSVIQILIIIAKYCGFKPSAVKEMFKQFLPKPSTMTYTSVPQTEESNDSTTKKAESEESNDGQAPGNLAVPTDVGNCNMDIVIRKDDKNEEKDLSKPLVTAQTEDDLLQ